MVLTNFESWAHDGSQPNNENIGGAVGGARRYHDLFNLSVIQACGAGVQIQCNNNDMTTNNGDQGQPEHQEQQNDSQGQQKLSINNLVHNSSNGYYGFSQICSKQNNENTIKTSMEEDMMDVSSSGATRKRPHESNINEAKRCRFNDIDSKFDDFCQTSFAPNSLNQSFQQNIDQQLQQSNEQQNYMINNKIPETLSIYTSNNLQNSSISNTSTNTYNDMNRCMSSHMI